MKRSPDAIRYIDPSWNQDSANGKLYPNFFYKFGWAKRGDPETQDELDINEEDQPEEPTIEEDSQENDEVSIEDRIWTLALDF